MVVLKYMLVLAARLLPIMKVTVPQNLSVTTFSRWHSCMLLMWVLLLQYGM